ncbi:GH3 family domain-containing protein [Robertkochia aurantiaca]|uniref:GH3 family domain-containing protein n=1 Tax=Robertkochia aurantiaca TaxID=2873700 RepID=UPI001CC9C878|nr:GH3 auxin-responsive promoter family protein [Robertkochia sp. 3YJGBD-33]
MAIYGYMIKGLLEMREKLVPESDPIEDQKKVLSELLEQAKDTAFGKFYDFSDLLEAENIKEAFAAKVPLFNYDKINSEWWYRLHQGESDITWPGKPSYYALSSGTTGKESKRIPVTEEMIECITLAGRKQVYAITNFDMPPDFFEKEILMLGSSTDLKRKGDHQEGEISGISASNIPNWFKGYYKPGEDIARIENWDDRVKMIAENAAEWDIGAISGIPSWIELMLEEVIEHHKLEHIHQIWPNLQVYTSGGVAFDPYEKSFNALMGKPVTVIDTYLASEGFIAFQQRPETSAMRLLTDNGIYFEFVPFEPEYINEDGSLKKDAPVIPLEEVKTEKDYVLLISTVSGLWRYEIGDTITFTDLERKEIKITGRTKFFLNVVGSQLSVNKLNDGIKELENAFDIEIKEFTMAAKRYDEEFYHSWYLGTEADVDPEQAAEVLDEYLKSANKNYEVARGKALKGVKVKVIPPEIFYEWNAQKKKKGGQVKMPRVMGEEKFSEWEEFVAAQL